MESEYKVIQIQKKTVPQDKYDFPVTENRYIIVSASDISKIIDDAQGYGYKTRQNAEKAAWYKFKGGKSKLDSEKNSAQAFWNKHSELKDEIENMMFTACKEGRELTLPSIAEYVKVNHNIILNSNWIKYM